MSPYKKQQRHKKRKNLFRKLHRWIGFTSALFLINLAITGILLNHSDDLNLHKKYIASSWLVNWYGFNVPNKFTCVLLTTNTTKLCQVGTFIYKDNLQLIETKTPLIGSVNFDNLIYIATENDITIFTKNFERVETIDSASGLPIPVKEIGFITINDVKYLSIKDIHGTWFFDQENNTWSKSNEPFQPSVNHLSLETEQIENFQDHYLKNKISYLKFIQDLHSGRILNVSGKLITDLSGLVIVLLSISGFFAWQRRKEYK